MLFCWTSTIPNNVTANLSFPTLHPIHLRLIDHTDVFLLSPSFTEIQFLRSEWFTGVYKLRVRMVDIHIERTYVFDVRINGGRTHRFGVKFCIVNEENVMEKLDSRWIHLSKAQF
ncbi:hypothetical protein L596_022849 [Steinernema carpocapsae]|uniref:Uncharacterized protein n=1 Tax=Steinernema carpocapsae TaxID=34508 RepID=A0A4V6A0C8_STECR|nr:hypothetical protein L596_022849 [Steinernema carpocapsae]